MTPIDQCAKSAYEDNGGAPMALRRIDPSTAKPCSATRRVQGWFSQISTTQEVTK